MAKRYATNGCRRTKYYRIEKEVEHLDKKFASRCSRICTCSYVPDHDTSEPTHGPSAISPATSHSTSAEYIEDVTTTLSSPTSSLTPPRQPNAKHCDAFSDRLAAWCNQHNITHVAANHLLGLLHTCPGMHELAALPHDARTLLKTPRSTNIREAFGGEYVYLGIYPGITKELDRRCQPDGVYMGPTDLLITIGIDGIPLYHSSTSQFWPIMAMAKELSSTVILVALFFGKSKPSTSSGFLSDFATKLNSIQSFTYKGVEFTIRIKCVVCDAPARSFVKATRQFNGYFGCDKCIQKGQWHRKMTYSELGCTLRQDDDCTGLNMEKEENRCHFIGTYALPAGRVSSFPIDPMHCVYLGVCRAVLRLWLKVRRQRFSLSSLQVDRISSSLVQFGERFPALFQRKPRSLSDLDLWKATEFRQFLIYLAPMALRKVVHESVYHHFMTLHAAIRMLSGNIEPDIVQHAEELLCSFVEEYGTIYGGDTYTYNVHALTHLAADVRMYGKLDTFSAFPFENYLMHLKKLIRSYGKPLAQVVRRISELSNTRPSSLSHKCRPRPGTVFHYGRDKLVVLVSRRGNAQWKCKMMSKSGPVYTYPVDSQRLGIFYGTVGSSLTLCESDLNKQLVSTEVRPDVFYCATIINHEK